MKFQTFTRSNLNSLRNELNAVLAKYGQEANLEFKVGNMKFAAQDVEIKVSAKVIGGVSVADQTLARVAKMYNLTTEVRGGRQLVEYRNRGKYNFIYRDDNNGGKLYKTDLGRAQIMFGNKG